MLLRVLDREGPVESLAGAPREPELRNAAPHHAGEVVGVNRLRHLHVRRPEADLILLRGHQAEGLSGAHVERIAVAHLGERVPQPEPDAGAGHGDCVGDGSVEVHFEIAGKLPEPGTVSRVLGEIGVDANRDPRGLRGQACLGHIALQRVGIRNRREAGARAAATAGGTIEAGDPEIPADTKLRGADSNRRTLGLFGGNLLRRIELDRRLLCGGGRTLGRNRLRCRH